MSYFTLLLPRELFATLLVTAVVLTLEENSQILCQLTCSVRTRLRSLFTRRRHCFEFHGFSVYCGQIFISDPDFKYSVTSVSDLKESETSSSKAKKSFSLSVLWRHKQSLICLFQINKSLCHQLHSSIWSHRFLNRAVHIFPQTSHGSFPILPPLQPTLVRTCSHTDNMV